MAGRCSPPRSVSVRQYVRAPKRRKAKTRTAAGPKAGTTYYVVENERTGRTTGTKHRNFTAAVDARVRANRQSFRRGQGRPWNVERKTA